MAGIVEEELEEGVTENRAEVLQEKTEIVMAICPRASHDIVLARLRAASDIDAECEIIINEFEQPLYNGETRTREEIIREKTEIITAAFPEASSDVVSARLSDANDIDAECGVLINELEILSTAGNELPNNENRECFFEQAQFWMKQTYSNWKDTLGAEFGQAKTICLPDSLDVEPNKWFGPTKPAAGFDKKEVKKAKSRLKGEKGEETFFTAFRKLNLGGILLHGFESIKFIKVMRDRAVSGFEKLQCDEHNFECDFVFVHQRLGIVVIETKGCERGGEVIQRYKKAVKQLHTHIAGLKNLYRLLSGECDDPFEVRGIVCMSGIEISDDNTCELKKQNAFQIIDKITLKSEDNFMQFWRSMLNPAIDLSEHLTKFITAIFAYRPATFMSSTCNALEIHRRIEKQDFRTKKNKVSQTIFYNADQLHAIECNSQRVLISGPPGTGKTLCLLQRVLNAAKQDKSGRIILGVRAARELLPKLQLFCAENCAEMKRMPDIVLGISVHDCLPDDDLFYDESGFVLDKLADRALTTGSTTIVFTGFTVPSRVETKTLQTYLNLNYEHFELRTVIRGTKTIINEWKTHFPDRYIRLGHNITGTTIERFSAIDFSEMLEIVQSKIASLLTLLPPIEATSGQNMSEPYQFMPGDIVVLTLGKWSPPACFFTIRSHLSANGFQSGSIAGQVGNSKVIAVGEAIDALSYEWPIVIVVAFTNGESNLRKSSHYLIATSRAIAKLIVVDVTLTDAEI